MVFGEETLKEVDLNNEEFYEMIKEKGLPTSSQPSIGEFKDLFEHQIKAGDHVLGVFLSNKISGTFSTAMLARDMVLNDYPEAEIILLDSTSCCMQLGFSAEAAAKEALQGKELLEIKNAAEAIIDRSRFIFIPHDLEHLKRGGRIGKASEILGTLLNIIPILTMENGETTVYKKVRRKKKAVTELINTLLLDHTRYTVKEIVVHHINVINEARELLKNIESVIDVPVRIHDIGPVIGFHVGPGAIGLAYHTEKPIRNT